MLRKLLRAFALFTLIGFTAPVVALAADDQPKVEKKAKKKGKKKSNSPDDMK